MHLTSNKLIEVEKLNTVQCFTYLGKKKNDGKSEMDIKSNMAQEKQEFYKKKKHLFTTNVVSIKTRKTLTKNFVWSVVLYGVETWIILKAER